jgi:hypothetical protein
MAKRKTTRKTKRRRLSRPTPMQLAGTLFSHPGASIFTGKVDGKLPSPDSLPYVTRRAPKGTGYCYWSVNPTSNYEKDCATGRDYAQLLLPHLKYNAGITLLGSIVLDMIRAGEEKAGKGLIVGFMSEISRELASTRMSLALFATAAARCPQGTPARLKAGRAELKQLAAKAAVPTIKHLGAVF